MKRLVFVACLLSGCQSQFIKLAETPGEYPLPITKEKYLLTAWGWFIDRQIAINYPVIDYAVLIDNRKFKAELMGKYIATDRFKKEFPWFIQHQGKVDCEKKSNEATVIFIDEKLDKALKRMPVSGMNEISNALCLITELSQ